MDTALFAVGIAVYLVAGSWRSTPSDPQLTREIARWTPRQSVAAVGIVLVVSGLVLGLWRIGLVRSVYATVIAAILSLALTAASRRGWRYAMTLTALRAVIARRAGERLLVPAHDMTGGHLVFGWFFEALLVTFIMAVMVAAWSMGYPAGVGIALLGLPLVGFLAFSVAFHRRTAWALLKLRRIAMSPQDRIIGELEAGLAAAPSLDVLVKPVEGPDGPLW